MSISRRHKAFVTTTIAALLTLAIADSAPAAGQAPAIPAIEPAATAALDAMGTYLRTLKAFRVEATTAREVVLDDGLKVEHGGVTTVLARMPDRLRVDVSSDRQERQYLYDGKEFTLYAKRVDYYATIPAPPKVGELADVLEDRYGIEVPLVDLFRWGGAEAASSEVSAAADLGNSVIRGVTCRHYAFRQEGLDWQIWIQRGDFPLPRKLVLTTTTDEARPQFSAVYEWDLAPSFNDSAFAFVPPADAQRIVIAEIPAESGSESQE